MATVTEIYDHLRLMMARLGEPFCYQCGTPISQQTPEQILAMIMAFPEGTKAAIMAPLVRGRKGQHEEVLATIRKAGFVRARIDGEVYEIDSVPKLVKQKNHTIEAVVDRIIVREHAQSTRRFDSTGIEAQRGARGVGLLASRSACRRVARPDLQHRICLSELQAQL